MTDSGKFAGGRRNCRTTSSTRLKSFDLFDRQARGRSAGDLWVVMRALGCEPRKEDMKKMVGEVDQENTGQISFDGYLQIVLNKMVERPGHDDILKAFRLFDREGSGAVSFAQLKRIAQQIGETISDEELHEMIAEADRKGSGVVDEEDFVKIITSHAKHYDGEK